MVDVGKENRSRIDQHMRGRSIQQTNAKVEVFERQTCCDLRTIHRDRVAGKGREVVNHSPGLFGDWEFCSGCTVNINVGAVRST